MEGNATINLILESLQKVDSEIIQHVSSIKHTTKKEDLVHMYNDKASKFFDLAYTYTKNRSFKLYKTQFEQAIAMNKLTAIKYLGLYTLMYADRIYTKDSDYFISMYIPDYDSKEYNILKTKEFKLMWTECSSHQKDNIMKCMIDLVVIAHAYFLYIVTEI